jgi:hypothetical protein
MVNTQRLVIESLRRDGPHSHAAHSPHLWRQLQAPTKNRPARLSGDALRAAGPTIEHRAAFRGSALGGRYGAPIDRLFDEPLMLAERVALAGVFDEMEASDAQAVCGRGFVRDRPSLGEQIAIFGGVAKDSPAGDLNFSGMLAFEHRISVEATIVGR